MPVSVNGSRAREFKLALDQLPFTHIMKGSRFLGLILMGQAAVTGAGTAAMVIWFVQGIATPPIELFLIFAVWATIALPTGLHQLSSVTTTTIDARQVSFSSKSLIRSKQWMEEIDRYEGIAYREESHGGSKRSSPYTLHIVELYHADSKKTQKIYQSISARGVRAIWEDYCRKLNLPAVEKDGNTLIKRNVEDLDKSIRDLVKGGKLNIAFDPSRTPPKGVKVNAAGDIFEVILTKDEFSIVIYIFVLLFPGIFIFVSVNREGGLPFLIIGIIIGLVMVSALLWARFTKERIKIGEDTVYLNRITPWGETAGTTIITSEIESVVVDKKDNHFHKQVFIKTDQQQEAIGGGLSAEALEWLKNCIISIISL
jgi:hypothetical protein